MSEDYKFIHLLYVPTMNCNMKCTYCYLKENTIDLEPDDTYLQTLQYAVAKFRKSNVIPFNISLHGGEVTTLAPTDFRNIIAFIENYYQQNRKLLEANGFTIGRPHIKTNLFNIKKHIDTIREFQVSISGSLDLPFALHEQFRKTKGNQKTLDTILENIALLQDIPNKKKVSATIFKEHYEKMDEIIQDINYLDQHTCLDMNDFNFMIGFTTDADDLLTALTEEEQLQFYQKIKKAFTGTHLEEGMNKSWFAEFTPAYCTSCDNCGEKFFLLERNGDIYSCVRGQKNKDFYYGNIYQDSVEDILKQAQRKIFENHNHMTFNSECATCQYLYLCKTGCPYVKKMYHQNTSYTCKLQQAIYKDHPDLYPQDVNNKLSVYHYIQKMHPLLTKNYYPLTHIQTDDNISLQHIIESDEKLKNIYRADAFILEVDSQEYALSSQLLKSIRHILYITSHTRVKLYIKKDVLEDCDYPVNNALYMMLLSGDSVVYGDEQREKQKHIMTHQIYTDTLKSRPSDKQNFYCVDLTNILNLYAQDLSQDKPNNLFFTTSAWRDYHYMKQKNNAYYHIQAMNLPFQNIEFFYVLNKEENHE